MLLTKKLSRELRAVAFVLFPDPIENVQVQAEMKPAVESSSYTLLCNVRGDADHIYWMKNDEHLHEDNTIILRNMKLVFMPVQRSDTGHYRCMAKNAFGNMTSAPYMLVVNCEYDI